MNLSSFRTGMMLLFLICLATGSAKATRVYQLQQAIAAENNSLKKAFQDSDKVDSILIAKNFPVLQKMRERSDARAVLLKNRVFKQVEDQQQKRIVKALNTCSTVSCYAEAIKWTSTEINLIADELLRVNPLKSDTAMLRKSWTTAATGINRIFDVYISSKAPRYAKIDSISFKRGDTILYKAVYNLLSNQVNTTDHQQLFFEQILRAAIAILRLNGRDEAARYEPLKAGLNAAPFRRSKQIDWSAFPYSIILVPGLGPEKPGVALDPNGAKRCDEAVIRYKKGLAPFIVVSGGQVHPFRTPFNEAVEMKKYLVEKAGIPEDAVFIEPHARHTTTNIRNASRMLYRFGMPVNKPVLIVTDTSQSKYIVERMDKIAIRDLGYVPFKNIQAISAEDTSFYPLEQSLEPDPIDPLDP
jgi:hypothetical protein